MLTKMYGETNRNMEFPYEGDGTKPLNGGLTFKQYERLAVVYDCSPEVRENKKQLAKAKAPQPLTILEFSCLATIRQLHQEGWYDSLGD